MQQNTRQYVLGAIAIALAVIAAIYYARRAQAPPAPSETVTLDGICLACKADVSAPYPAGQRQPATCPKCGKRAVYGTFYCYDCKLRFVPNLEPASDGGPPRMPMIPTCPSCNGRNASGFIAEDPDHAAARRGPLPPWSG